MRGEFIIMSNRKGFTLFEIVVATTIMAAMVMALVGFVQMASASWVRTDIQVNLSAEANNIIETLRYYAVNAASVTPVYIKNKVNIATYAYFVVNVATGSISSYEYVGTITIRVSQLANKPNILVATYTAVSPTGSNRINWSESDTGINVVKPSIFTATLTERLASFTVKREHFHCLDFYLCLESPLAGENYSQYYATPSYELYFSVPIYNLATESKLFKKGGKRRKR